MWRRLFVTFLFFPAVFQASEYVIEVGGFRDKVKVCYQTAGLELLQKDVCLTLNENNTIGINESSAGYDFAHTVRYSASSLRDVYMEGEWELSIPHAAGATVIPCFEGCHITNGPEEKKIHIFDFEGNLLVEIEPSTGAGPTWRLGKPVPESDIPEYQKVPLDVNTGTDEDVIPIWQNGEHYIKGPKHY